jgi:hypothetical protein
MAIFIINKFIVIEDTSLSFWLSFVNGFGGYTSVPSVNFYSLLIIFSNLIIVLSFYKTNLTNFKSKYIIFLASISMIWMLYYVNRMFDQNLWFLIVLLTLIFILLLDEILRDNIVFILIPTLFSILVLISYQITLSAKQFSFPYSSQECDDRSIFPDLCFNPELTDKTILEFDYILRNVNPSQSIILTGFPSEFRLLGYNKDFHYYSLLADAFTNSEILKFSTRLDVADKDTIILHTNREFYFHPPIVDDYDIMVKTLKNYKLSYSTDRFDIYKKTKN